MRERFSQTFTAQKSDIDIMGHVNNAVWVQWMETLATSHWAAVATTDHQARYAWLVTRHEIDYRGNIREGESVTGQTYLPGLPHGAKLDRCVEFRNATDKVIVSARTTWAMIDIASGRLMRVPPEVAAPFFER